MGADVAKVVAALVPGRDGEVGLAKLRVLDHLRQGHVAERDRRNVVVRSDPEMAEVVGAGSAFGPDGTGSDGLARGSHIAAQREGVEDQAEDSAKVAFFSASDERERPRPREGTHCREMTAGLDSSSRTARRSCS